MTSERERRRVTLREVVVHEPFLVGDLDFDLVVVVEQLLLGVVGPLIVDDELVLVDALLRELELAVAHTVVP